MHVYLRPVASTGSNHTRLDHHAQYFIQDLDTPPSFFFWCCHRLTYHYKSARSLLMIWCYLSYALLILLRPRTLRRPRRGTHTATHWSHFNSLHHAVCAPNPLQASDATQPAAMCIYCNTLQYTVCAHLRL